MSLNVNSMLDAMNDETIGLYTKLMSAIDDNIVFKKNGVIINGKTVIPPKIVYVNERLAELKARKQKLLLENYDLYNDIIMIPLEKIKNTTKEKYEKLLEDINMIDIEIDNLHNYTGLLHNRSRIELDRLTDIYNNSVREQKLLIDNGNDIDRYLKLHAKIQKTKETINDEKSKRTIDFYIEKLPQLSNVVLKEIDKIPESKENESKEKEPSKKEKTKVEKVKVEKSKTEKTKTEKTKKITPKQLETIKSNIKELLGSKYLKAKSKDECVSQKRSQPYYMSLKAILEEIEKQPELKAVLPKNYKTLSKEKLCEYLY